MEENVNNSETENVPGEKIQRISYVRRLDRTPEKDFNLRNEDEKKIVCERRKLTGKVKEKIDRLERELEDREKLVATERQLRVQAEQKLQSVYEDMYLSPTVNRELRDRLPRANKSDPFKPQDTDVSESELSSIEEQIVEEEETSKSESCSKAGMHKEKRRSGSPKANSKHSSKSSDKLPGKKLDFDSEGRKPSSPFNASGTQTGLDHSHTMPFSTLSPPLRGFYNHPLGASSSFMPYPNTLLSGNLGTYPGPYLASSSLYSPPSLTRHLSFPNMHFSPNPGLSLPPSQPLMQSQSLSNLETIKPSSQTTPESSSSSPQKMASTSIPENTGSAHQSSSGLFNISPDSGLGASFAGQRSFSFLQRHALNPPGTSILPDPFLTTSSPRQSFGLLGPGYDQSRQIAHLLKEIDAQRLEAKQLRTQLADREAELDVLKLTMKVKGTEHAVGASEMQQAAGVVEEVYTAQRKRDEAMTGRMKLANEEKDDVMARLRQIEARLDSQGAGTSFMEPSVDELHIDVGNLDNSEELYTLLSRLDSPSSGDGEMSAVVSHVEAMRQRQREVTNEEMAIVMEQRDIALAKCRKLEEQLLKYQRESDADGGMDKTVRAKLAALQQERDIAVAKSQQLDNEVQTLRIYYGLRQSISSSNSFQQSTHHPVSEELNSTRQQLEGTEKENKHLVSQLRINTIEKKQLEQALESVRQDRERLQKLVGILKKKLNTEKPDT